MDRMDVLKKIMEDYRRITGLRSYLILDDKKVESASERNYFCKCLKSSTSALKKCEECAVETYQNAQEENKECIYSCHAGLIKWVVPVVRDGFNCMIVSEGILGQKQKDNADEWAKYLGKEYDLNIEMIKKNFEVCIVMDEAEMKASIQLLKDLITYHITIFNAQDEREAA